MTNYDHICAGFDCDDALIALLSGSQNENFRLNTPFFAMLDIKLTYCELMFFIFCSHSVFCHF